MVGMVELCVFCSMGGGSVRIVRVFSYGGMVECYEASTRDLFLIRGFGDFHSDRHKICYMSCRTGLGGKCLCFSMYECGW